MEKMSRDCFSFCCGAPVMPFCQMELNIPSPLTLEVLENSVFFYIPISAVSELQEKYQEVSILYNRLLIQALNEHWRLKQILKFLYSGAAVSMVSGNLSGADRKGEQHAYCFLPGNDSCDTEPFAEDPKGEWQAE